VTRQRPPPPGFCHVFAFVPSAVYFSPDAIAYRYKLGAWMCVMCHVLLDFAVKYDLDHGDDCPGWIAPAPRDATLPGTPPLSPAAQGYWESRAQR
jgi:hypothetical protein